MSRNKVTCKSIVLTANIPPRCALRRVLKAQNSRTHANTVALESWAPNWIESSTQTQLSCYMYVEVSDVRGVLEWKTAFFFFLFYILKKTIIEWKKHCNYILRSKYSGSAVKQCHCVNCTSATVLKCDDSNSTLAVRLGFDLHRFLQVLSFFGKEKK